MFYHKNLKQFVTKEGLQYGRRILHPSFISLPHF